MGIDWTAVFLVLLAVAGWGLLILAVIAYRQVIAERAALPLWRFLKRSGIWRRDAADATAAHSVLHAELCCALCGDKPLCVKQLAAGATAPMGHCPNAHLFDALHIRAAEGPRR